jgi:hypothetical protein
MNMHSDFCLEIKFKKDFGDPTRVFRSMTSMIEGLQQLDTHLVRSIHSGMKPVLLLEDIEVSSIRTWFKLCLEQVHDDALKNLNWKPLVGQYLVKGKYMILKFLEEREKVTSYAEIEALEQALVAEAMATDVRRIPYYQPISKRQLLEDMITITDAIKPLSEWDEARYITPSNTAKFNFSFAITPETIEEILVKETITNEETLILKVKKPDYLGESKWEFQIGKIITAKIEDAAWLVNFRGRKPEARILPGDSLRVVADHTTKYGFDNEVISEEYVIREVLGVNRPPVRNDPEQQELFS